MRYGLSLFTSDRGIRPADAAKAAEANGFDAFYVPEHTHIPVSRIPITPEPSRPNCPTTVTCAHSTPGLPSAPPRRSQTPSDWAPPWPSPSNTIRSLSRKTIASLDHLSGGRVVFGVGFGWNAEELADHGVPPNKRRTALREYLEAMGELWSKEEASYDGQFVKYGPAGRGPNQFRSPVLPSSWAAAATRRLSSGSQSLPTGGSPHPSSRRSTETWNCSERSGRSR